MLVRSNDLFPMLFNDVFGSLHEGWNKPLGRAPQLNIKENRAEFVLEFLVPGLSREDLSLTLDPDNNLVVAMERKDVKALPQPAENEAKASPEPQEEKTAAPKPEADKYRYLRHDFHRAHFRQVVALPDGIHRDRIHAKVESGILRITLPKVTPEEQAQLAQTIAIE